MTKSINIEHKTYIPPLVLFEEIEQSTGIMQHVSGSNEDSEEMEGEEGKAKGMGSFIFEDDIPYEENDF